MDYILVAVSEFTSHREKRFADRAHTPGVPGRRTDFAIFSNFLALAADNVTDNVLHQRTNDVP
jgi:hypothetical protein